MIMHRSENIISFASRATSASMQNLRDMHAYWERLRCGRAIPKRSDVDPREITPLLEHGFLLERVSPGDIRFRLAGMGIGDLMGMDVRSMPLRALIKPDLRPEFSESLEQVFEAPEIHTYQLVSDQVSQSSLKAAMILLPLLDDEGQVNRAIGALAMEGRVGFAPRRFVMTERLRTPIHGAASDTETTRYELPERATKKPIAAETQAEFTPARANAPFLRLVKG